MSVQAEIEDEIQQLREERPWVPEARARADGLQAELKMLKEAVKERPNTYWRSFFGGGTSADPAV